VTDWQLVGTCPRCLAPVHGVKSRGEYAPALLYSCNCDSGFRPRRRMDSEWFGVSEDDE